MLCKGWTFWLQIHLFLHFFTSAENLASYKGPSFVIFLEYFCQGMGFSPIYLLWKDKANQLKQTADSQNLPEPNSFGIRSFLPSNTFQPQRL